MNNIRKNILKILHIMVFRDEYIEYNKVYILKNSKGMKAVVSDFGAALLKLYVPDKNGKSQDVVLGYETLEDYENGGDSVGATVGRVANRIGTGAFELNGKKYELTKNDNGENTLHGGTDFYNKRMWSVKEEDDTHVVFMLVSPDGDQGFPGEVKIEVSYTVTEENELKIHYYAIPDQELIPTGTVIPVEGTPMDFREGKKVAKEIGADYKPLKLAGGYDHNWVLNGSGFRKVASAESEETGIKMEVYTDLPGIQFYSGNFLAGAKGKQGAVYGKGCGICFETQYFPDAIHKDNFESPITKAGEVYDTTTTYRFC